MYLSLFLANGFSSSSIPPIPTTHSISSPIITSPTSNQPSITNGSTPRNSTDITQTPSSLPVGVPSHPPAATAPTALAPSVHPGLDSAVGSAGRTNSPAVATSAVLSATAPATNGNSNATTVSAVVNGAAGLGAYRTNYPGYPLYAPYNNSPYLSPAVISPSASPRTVDSRTNRESPLINHSKGIRPITPTTGNNGHLPTSQHTAPSLSGITTAASQPVPSLRDQSQAHQPPHPSSLPLQKNNSPRGHSPNRERDSYRYVVLWFSFLLCNFHFLFACLSNSSRKTITHSFIHS